MLAKVLGLLLLLMGMVLAGYINRTGRATESAPTIRLYDVIVEDLNRLKKKRVLPPPWRTIKTVLYNFKTEEQRELFGRSKLPIAEHPGGTSILEIEFIDVPDDTSPLLILQMSLIDEKTKNKLWELGRAYPIREFGAVHADGKKQNPQNKKPN